MIKNNKQNGLVLLMVLLLSGLLTLLTMEQAHEINLAKKSLLLRASAWQAKINKNNRANHHAV